ncbi:MAG TPA: MBL fold metallo-hydrolase [Vicinamibacterales bacterium]|nr:MBL fold metallo-hydrolase [Vicinamibacterales bacterium]
MRHHALSAFTFAAIVIRIGTALHAGQPTAAPSPVGLLHVQRSVHMLVVNGMNIAIQVGDDGVLLVDAATAAVAPQVIAAIRTLSSKPIHTIVNTHVHADHTGGNESLVKQRGTGAAQPVRVMAHQSVQERMIAAAPPGGSTGGFRLNAAITLPINNTYDTPTKDFFLNGEAVMIYHAPKAHTDGDSLVHFRASDVIAVGDVFSPDRYPVIDLATGGSVQGLIAALNHVLEITVPARFQEGGTFVIPGHGRLSDEADVVEYRDMVTIIRDRVQDLIQKGLTFEQVKAARPSRDYDSEYDGDGGSSPDAFVEAIFRSLKAQ